MKREIKPTELKSLLPHRNIALCIDGAEIIDENTIECISFIEEDDPRLDGHFPDSPILPGHWIIESMALSGIIFIKSMIKGVDGIPLFREVISSKFYLQVSPPTCLTFTPTLVKNKANKIFIFKVLVTQKGNRVATGEIKGVIS